MDGLFIQWIHFLWPFTMPKWMVYDGKKQRMDDLRGNVGKTMTFLPPMTGNGKHTTYKKW